MARARGLHHYRECSLIAVSWWLLTAGLTLAVAAVTFLCQNKWWPAVTTTALAVAVGFAVAGRAVRLGRSEVMVVRAELLDAIRGLPPADAWIDRIHHRGYQLQVRPTLPGLAPAVYLAEMDLDGVVTTPSGGRRVTVRQYGVLPWQPQVRLEVTEGPVPGGPDDGQRPPRHSALAWVWQSWRARRAGMLFTQAAEVRQLAARLTDVDSLD